jgi:hypothetical protein
MNVTSAHLRLDSITSRTNMAFVACQCTGAGEVGRCRPTPSRMDRVEVLDPLLTREWAFEQAGTALPARAAKMLLGVLQCFVAVTLRRIATGAFHDSDRMA